jgi:hypothetical protein
LATGKIPTHQLVPFIRQLKPPLGVAVQKEVPLHGVAGSISTKLHIHNPSHVLQVRFFLPQKRRRISPDRPAAPSQAQKNPLLMQQKLSRLSSLSRMLSYTPEQQRRVQSEATAAAAVSALPDREVGSRNEALRIVNAVRSELYDREGSVFYYEVYFALLHRLLYVEIPPAEHAKIADRRLEQLQRNSQSLRVPSVSASAVETLAAIRLQALVRAHRTRNIGRTKAGPTYDFLVAANSHEEGQE